MSYSPRLAESTVIPTLEVMQSKCSDLMNKKQKRELSFQVIGFSAPTWKSMQPFKLIIGNKKY